MHETPRSDSSKIVLPVRVQLHGVLVRVLDTGVLLIGESGIGKSECALDLITKGHQLIADDVVEVIVTPGDGPSGKAPPLTFELLEIRGLGIINAREVFGERSVGTESGIDLCVELRKWSDADRIENVIGEYNVAGCAIPKFVLPVSSGRNLSTLVETAVRLFINRDTASSAGQLLLERHAALLTPTS